MIKSIEIKNYKRFQKRIKIDLWDNESKKIGGDFILDDHISSVAGILGKNASGKSTIIDAMGFYQSLVDNLYFKKIFEKTYIKKINELIERKNEMKDLELEDTTEISNKINEMMRVIGKDNAENMEFFKDLIDEHLDKSRKQKVNNDDEPIFFCFEYFDNNKTVMHELKIWRYEIEEKITLKNKTIYNEKKAIYGFRSELEKILRENQLEMTRIQIFLRNKRVKDAMLKQIIHKNYKREPDLFMVFLKIVDETIAKFTFNTAGIPVAYVSNESNESLDFDSLSEGTIKFIHLFNSISNAIKKKRILLIIDEIENSLHFALIKFIITIFKKRYNKRKSQLLFTSHNPYVFDGDFNSNSIYFLDNFELKRNEAPFDKKITPGYLKGELIANPDYKYRFEFLEKVISSYEKDD